MANPITSKPAAAAASKPALTAQGYLIAVLRMRESQKPREKKLLERVRPDERAKAEEMLAKLGG